MHESGRPSCWGGRPSSVARGQRPARTPSFCTSSGYLVVDVTAAGGAVQVGDELSFSVNYSALVAAMTSEYVKKCFVQGVP